MHTVRMDKPDRLKFAREKLYDSATAAAKALGVKVPTYISHENGTRDFGDKYARLYARRFRVPLPWLALNEGKMPDLSSEDVAAALRNAEEGEGLPYGGIVEAGAFRPVDLLDQSSAARRIKLDPVRKFELARQYAYEVRGDSMNLARIEEGMWLTTIDYHDYVERYGAVRAGTLVVVERTRAQGAERELTVKEVHFYRDHMELVPRSTNLTHKPLIVPRDGGSDNGEEVTIVAVVAQASWLYL